MDFMIASRPDSPRPFDHFLESAHETDTVASTEPEEFDQFKSHFGTKQSHNSNKSEFIFPITSPPSIARSQRAHSVVPSLARSATLGSIISTVSIQESEESEQWSPIQADLEFTVKALLSENAFELFMTDRISRFRFREYLVLQENEAIISFDLWTDLVAYRVLTDRLNITSQALHHNLETSSSPFVSLEVREAVLESLRSGMEGCDSLNLVQENLLRSLLEKQFITYVKFKLVEDASTRLGFDLEEDGLGEAFCLTNPRLPDHPIVLVSDAFERLTGFGAAQIVGKNCRFLSGPATSEAAVEKIRVGLNKATPTTTLLLNYKRNGQSFMNLLTILPLFGSDGSLTYFIGGQTEVTSNLTRLLSAPNTRVPGTDFDYNSAQFSPETESLITELESNSNSFSRKVSLALTKSRVRSFRGSLHSAEKRIAAGSQTVPEKGSTNSSVHVVNPRLPEIGSLRNLFRKSSENKKKGIVFDQSIMEAEGKKSSSSSAPLNVQVENFKSVYSRIILLRSQDRAILFASSDMLKFLGFPVVTRADLYSPPILNQDFLRYLKASSNGKSIKKSLTEAIKLGKSISISVALKIKGLESNTGDLMLHLTPMFAQPSSKPGAFVAIFA